jgi:hypothetical protein
VSHACAQAHGRFVVDSWSILEGLKGSVRCTGRRPSWRRGDRRDRRDLGRVLSDTSPSSSQPRVPVSPVLAIRVVSQPPYAAADGAGIDNVSQRSRRSHGPRRAHIRWLDRLPRAKSSRSTALPLSHLAWPDSCLDASQPTCKAGCNGWKTDEIREPGRVELPSTRVVRLIRAALPTRCRDFVPEAACPATRGRPGSSCPGTA